MSENYNRIGLQCFAEIKAISTYTVLYECNGLNCQLYRPVAFGGTSLRRAISVNLLMKLNVVYSGVSWCVQEMRRRESVSVNTPTCYWENATMTDFRRVGWSFSRLNGLT